MRHAKYVVLVLLVVLAACGTPEAEPELVAVQTATPPPTDTPIPPLDTPDPPTAGNPTTNIQYLDSFALDVYLPETGDGPFPTLLLLVGSGADKKYMQPMWTFFAEHGYAAVAPTWSVTSMHTDWSAAYSEPFCALAWLHTHAESYGFDPERIGVFGWSAGAMAVSMMGTVDDPSFFLSDCTYRLPSSNWTQAVATYGGVFATREGFIEIPPGSQTFFELYANKLGIPDDEQAELHDTLIDTPYDRWFEIGGLSENSTTLVQSLAPFWIDGSEPPFLIVLGGLDNLVGPRGQEEFAGLLQAAGVDAELEIIPDAEHAALMGPAEPGFEDVCQAIMAFLNRVFE